MSDFSDFQGLLISVVEGFRLQVLGFSLPAAV